jgi:hypothetical protein
MASQSFMYIDERKLKIVSDDQAVAPAVIRRVMRELKELDKNPPEGIRIQTNEADLLDVTGIIEGPGEYRLLGT